jgi:hypothetical protein
MRWKKKFSDNFDSVWNPVEIWWKPAFSALKYGKAFIMRWKEKYSDDFDGVRSLVNIWWKPAFWAEKDGKQYKIWF